MSTVTVKTVGNKVVLVSPFHPDLPARAKMIGGRFSSKDKSWSFDARDETRVLDLARELYGTDGRIEVETVTVRVELTYAQAKGQSVWMFGREIVTRTFRDAAVKLAPGVILIRGSFRVKGGSQKYPQIFENVSERVTLEVRDVPLALAQQAQRDNPDLVQIVTITESTMDISADASNPLAEFSDEDLIAEVARRGIEIKIERDWADI
jgi:hypothetical protein